MSQKESDSSCTCTKQNKPKGLSLQDNCRQNNAQICLCFSQRADRWCAEEAGWVFHNNCFLPGWLLGRNKRRKTGQNRQRGRWGGFVSSSLSKLRAAPEGKQTACRLPTPNQYSLWEPRRWVSKTRKGAMRASKRCTRNLRQQTAPQAQHTGMSSALAIKRCFYSSQNDVDGHKFLLGTQQWKHANEMAEQNPGRVCSCLMSWELWLHSEHLLQIFYTGFTQVCGAFGNTELEGSKLRRWQPWLCVIISELMILKPPRIMKSTVWLLIFKKIIIIIWGF